MRVLRINQLGGNKAILALYHSIARWVVAIDSRSRRGSRRNLTRSSSCILSLIRSVSSWLSFTIVGHGEILFPGISHSQQEFCPEFRKSVSLNHRFAMSRSPRKGQLWPHVSFFTIAMKGATLTQSARIASRRFQPCDSKQTCLKPN
jgi:hypothetical protein